MQDLVGIVRREEEMQQALERDLRSLRKRAEASPSQAIANTTTAGTPHSICTICSRFRGSSRARPSSARKAGARIFAKTIPQRMTRLGRCNIVIRKSAGR